MCSASYFCSLLLPVSFVTYSIQSHGHASSHGNRESRPSPQARSQHGLAVPGRAAGIAKFHVNRFQERPRTNHLWRQVSDSHKNCGKVLLRSRICSSKLSKSQRGQSHPQGPRPNNRRHLSAVQEMFGSLVVLKIVMACLSC
jgi:hypothetical protein